MKWYWIVLIIVAIVVVSIYLYNYYTSNDHIKPITVVVNPFPVTVQQDKTN